MMNLIKKMDASLTLQIISVVVLVLLAAASGVSAAQEIQINRYVLAVSANYGGEGRPTLRYAASDARSFVNVLKEMGGVQAGNVVEVKEPSVAAFQQKIDELDKKIAKNKSAGGRDEVLVYYSGHADEKGLRLGKETFAWKALRSKIDSLHADVKIAVIDACGSGAITRAKGGVAVPAFMVDKSSDMKGYAFITSSTQDESSQESDKLKGSFFTHSLVSGLRGAGDISGDGKVTLSEAYQFAFNETLQKTEATMGGAQHPSRDMNLAGTGDVVMTDLRSMNAGLDIGEDVEGRLFIRDERGELVAELYKKAGRPINLGLAAGKYSVRLERPAEYKEASVTLQDNYRAQLTQKQFSAIVAEKTTLRGEIARRGDCDSGDTTACALDSLDHNGKYRVTFNLVDKDREARKGLQMGLFVTRTDSYMLGSQISIFANIARKEMHGLQLTAVFNGAREHYEGAQVSGVMNYAGSFDGIQVSPVINVAKENSSGVQVSATMNVTRDSLNGVQVAPAINYARETKAQISAALNAAKKSGVQVTAALNAAKESDVQVAAAMNVAGKLNTAQVSVLNIAGRADGRQVGILNICGHCEKTPVGLVNIVGNGVWSVTGSLNEMGALGVSLHMGTAYLYTALEGARLIEKGTEFRHFSDVFEAGLGLGTQFGKYGSHFDLEYMLLMEQGAFDFDDSDFEYGSDNGVNFHHRLRLGYTTRVFPFFGLSVGGTLNVAAQGYREKIWVKPLSEYHDDFGHEGDKFRFWPGFYAGITVGRF